MRLFVFAALLTALVGCRPEGQCAIDSDCPIRFRCMANQCTAIAPVDSGSSIDAAVAVDAGALPDANADTNVSTVDAFSVDAGPLPDADQDVGPLPDAFAPPDAFVGPDAFAPPDAFVDPCLTLESDYSVSSFSRGCLAVGATRVMFTRPGRACTYTLASDDDISGMVSLTGTTLGGALSIGTRGYPTCTVRQSAASGQVTLACGTCTVALLPLP